MNLLNFYRCLSQKVSGFLILMAVLLVAHSPASLKAAEPSFTSIPADGGEYDPSFGIQFIFSQAMKETIAIEWQGTGDASISCDWSVPFPGLPRQLLACDVTGTLPGGGTVTWTLNPDRTGFETETGQVLLTTTGSFTVPGDGGTGGGTGEPAPPCPADLTPLPFPKRTSVCGEDMTAWDSASVFPSYGSSGFILGAGSQGDSGSFPSLIKYDETGMAEWKAILPDTSGELSASSSDNLVFASIGGTSGSTDVEFGVFDAANGFTPAFQNLISPVATQHSLSHEFDGTTVLLENAGSTVNVTVFDANGAVMWARQYSSDLFLASPGGGLTGDSQTARITRINPLNAQDGYLLQVVISEQDIQAIPPVATNTIILASLAADGSVQWANSFAGLSGVSALTPAVSSGRSGAFYLNFSETQFDGTTASFNSKLVKLNGNGVIQWSKEFDSFSVSVRAELANNNVLGTGFAASGGLDSGNPGAASLVFVLDGNTGNIQNQVGVSKEVSDTLSVGGASASRIYYSLNSSDGTAENSSMNTVSVGYSTLQLEGFTFQEYVPRKFQFGSLTYNEVNGGNLIFSGFSTEDHAADILTLDADLQPNADCDLFTPTTVTTSNPGIVAMDTTISSSAITLNSSDLSPAVSTGDIAIGTFDASEMSLCENGMGGDCSAPAILSISRSSETEVTVEFTTTDGCSYILRQATSLNPPDWTSVGTTIPGTGAPVSMPFTIDNDETYFQAKTTQ